MIYITKSKKIYNKYEDYNKIENNIKYRKCPDCEKWYELSKENFMIRNKNDRDGFSKKCRTCQEKYNHDTYMNNQKINIDRASKRNQNNRESYLEYLKQWKIDNPEYMPEYNKAYYAANYEKFYEKLARWEKENPDRVRHHANKKRHHDITKNEWLACKEFFKDEDGDYCCAYCGLKLKNHNNRFKNGLRKEDFHKEHVDDDGYNDIRNCVPSCKSCNSFKGSYDFNVWYCSDNPKWTQERYDKIIQWITEEYKKYIEEKPPYKIKRQIVHNEDGTSFNQRQLWSIDEKRNLINIILTANTIDKIKDYIKNNKIFLMQD